MKPGIGWPVGIVAVLGATIVANLWVMRVANSDPSFAIEPDYYQKAVAFDSTIATERRSLALGWTATTSIAATDTAGRPMLTVTIVDAQRQPVQGATVSVVALANARANDIRTATLHEVSPGRYQSTLAASFAGQWEVRVDAVRGAEHFVASTRTDMTITRPATVPPVSVPDSTTHGGTGR